MPKPMNRHPTPAGVDGERSEPLHPCPRWAVRLQIGDALPVARQAAHAKRTNNTLPICPIGSTGVFSLSHGIMIVFLFYEAI